MSHANAALTPRHRLRLARLVVDDGWPPSRAAEFFHVSWRTAVRRRIPRQCLFPTLAAEMRPPQRLPVEVAAQIGHDREPSTETPPSPPPPAPASTPRSAVGHGGQPSRAVSRRPNSSEPVIGSAGRWTRRHEDLLVGCRITSWQAWDDYVAQVREARSAAGQPLSRWSAAHLLTALDLAVRGRGWPAEHAAAALLHMAADPATRSPARLAEAGPWWDTPAEARTHEPVEVDHAALEVELDSAGGLRVQLQRTAREQLAAEGRPLTRTTVISRAVDLLRSHST